MLVIGAAALGIFITLLGFELFVATIYGRWFKVGHYPKNRLSLLAFTGLAALISALLFRIFMNPPRDIYWLAYFVIAVLLFFPPWLYLLRSLKKKDNVIEGQQE